MPADHVFCAPGRSRTRNLVGRNHTGPNAVLTRENGGPRGAKVAKLSALVGHLFRPCTAPLRPHTASARFQAHSQHPRGSQRPLSPLCTRPHRPCLPGRPHGRWRAWATPGHVVHVGATSRVEQASRTWRSLMMFSAPALGSDRQGGGDTTGETPLSSRTTEHGSPRRRSIRHRPRTRLRGRCRFCSSVMPRPASPPPWRTSPATTPVVLVGDVDPSDGVLGPWAKHRPPSGHEPNPAPGDTLSPETDDDRT